MNTQIANNNRSFNCSEYNELEAIAPMPAMARVAKWQRRVRLLCLPYEEQAKHDFTWDAVSVLQVFDTASRDESCAGVVRQAQNEGISQHEILSALEHLLGLKASAEPWGRVLAAQYAAGRDLLAPGATCSNDVDAFVACVTDETTALRAIRGSNPLLYGEIFSETSRHLVVLRRIADSKVLQ
jgi:hypothetical protein